MLLDVLWLPDYTPEKSLQRDKHHRELMRELQLLAPKL